MGRALGISLIDIQCCAHALVMTEESPRAVAAGLDKEPVTFGSCLGRGQKGREERGPGPAEQVDGVEFCLMLSRCSIGVRLT